MKLNSQNFKHNFSDNNTQNNLYNTFYLYGLKMTCQCQVKEMIFVL